MPQDCVEEMRKAFETRRDLLVEGLNAIPGIHCVKPQGAFYVMMNISALLGKRLEDRFIANTSDFAEALLEKMHVAVVPGNAFMSETCCRLSYATATEEIKEGLRRIAAFVKDLR